MNDYNNNPTIPDRVIFLDGIRGWASLMVLFSHLVIFFLSNSIREFQPWIFAIVSDGNLAIFIFFVLSGFVLTVGFEQSGKREIITALALRRYPRLAIPVAATCLLAYVLAQFDLFYNIEAGNLSGNQWLTGFYRFPTDITGCLKFAFYDVFTHYDGERTYNPVLWTMGIELWASFVVFSIAALVLHLKNRVYVLCVILVYLILVNNIYYLPFVCGICLSISYRTIALRFSKQVHYLTPFLLLFVVYYSCSTLRGGLFGLPALPRNDFLSIMCSSAIIFMAATHVHIRRFFENKLSRYLGSISFPLYLTHFLVLCSFSSYLLVQLHSSQWGADYARIIIFVLSLAVCIVVAHLFRHIERFSIQFARHFSILLMPGRHQTAGSD